MLKQLFPYTKGYRLAAVLGPLFIICEVLLEIQIPKIMSYLVDIGIYSGDFSYVLSRGAQMLLVAVLSLTCGVLASVFSARAAMGLGANLRYGLFSHIQEYSFSNIDKFSTGSLITRLTTDITNTQNAFLMCMRMLIRSPFMLVSSTVMAFSINSRLSAVFLVAIPFLGIGLGYIAFNAFPRFSVMLEKFDRLNSRIQEALIAIRVVKSFVRGEYESKLFYDATDDVRRTQVFAERLVILNLPLMMITMFSCSVAISWFGGNMILDGSLKTGELISIMTYITQILVALMMMSMVFVMLVISRASIGRICEALNETPDISDDGADPGLEVADGSIDFENVTFSYPGSSSENVLENINLHIKSGMTVGIVGGTGSSKSSLVQLIPRLYDVVSGSVRVGGRDVRDYKLDTLRGAVAMVLQKNVLFSGTIAENLRWGSEDASDDELVAAAKAAQAHDFITAFPDGYDTELGQGGSNVSGGQKQRLCIARALLKKPKILILDDSTSAVDTATDAKIRASLKETAPGLTKLIIAQRTASVEDADLIIVMADGRVDSLGTHAELMEKSDIYREVYNSQNRRGE